VKGDVYTSLTEEAGYADLLILGQPDSDDLSNHYRDLPDRTLLTSGRPCLIVPYIGAKGNIGRNPLVAWNGTRESNRALHDALPLLERAETVTIMISQTLLVMGAYGHSRLREIVLGGMTRDIMQSMTVPVLMSH